MAPARELVVASQNPGKRDEMRVLLAGLPFEVVNLADLGIADGPEETGATFLENAGLKARWYSSRTGGRLTVADDSGLSVRALGGGPGLYSSRFGGPGASDDDRNRLLLERLRGLPPGQRGARFTSAVAAACAGEVLFTAEEHVDGFIAEETRGTNGFGYDPLFYYPPFQKTFGEVPRPMKDGVSHRGKAFARLREFLLSSSAGVPCGG